MNKMLEKINNTENNTQFLPDENKVASIENKCDNHEIKLLIEPTNKIRFIIIDFSCINYIDSVAVRVLNNIYSSLEKCKISMLIAAPNSKVRRAFEISKFINEDLNELMFVTVHDAVLRSLKE